VEAVEPGWGGRHVGEAGIVVGKIKPGCVAYHETVLVANGEAILQDGEVGS
jgi:hypothetical protein